MNIETIQNEVADFHDTFFLSSLELIDSNFEFIDQHKLLETKTNYFFTLHFLQTTINNFTNLDYEFSSSTLRKLHRDINNIYKIYLAQEKENVTMIFEKIFLPTVILFQDMKAEILSIQNTPISKDDTEDLKTIQGHIQQMEVIYFEVFEKDYREEKLYILNSLKSILNTKLYYLNQLLWQEAADSRIITRVHKNITHNKQINAKIYIQHRLETDIPYTDNYKYLQKCLKVYR